MKILGLKLTHDGGIALIDNGQLIFCYEMEKLNNNNRIESFNLKIQDIENILNGFGYSLFKMDRITIDGWTNYDHYRKNEENESIFKESKLSNDLYFDIKIAKYGMLISGSDKLLEAKKYTIEPLQLSYSSYMHITGHLFSAYCTSPFAKDKENSFVLVWDGGMPPQLFHYDASKKEVKNLGVLFYFAGHVYTGFAHEYAPFDKTDIHDYSVAGKLMAYIALGNLNEDLLYKFYDIYDNLCATLQDEVYTKSIEWFTQAFIIFTKNHCKHLKISNEDILFTFHTFLEQLLLKKLKENLLCSGFASKSICFSGGCALNIKWNAKIRDLDIIDHIWVPPFPSDSGSAIGAACAAMVDEGNQHELKWTVYSGPQIIDNYSKNNDFTSRPCSLIDLAFLLYEQNEPVIFLNERAELGPRALGNRSIIAPAVHYNMKKVLNRIKDREDYRPVAPICLEEDAPTVFSPGSPDPYMLFEHMVKKEWQEKIPTIVHLDGSARLQTVNKKENLAIYSLLAEYKRLSGIPLLCNTSANFKGKGFFPDVISAIEWNQVNYVWTNNILYTKTNKIPFNLTLSHLIQHE